MTIQRYRIGQHANPHGDRDGEWVRYEDHAKERTNLSYELNMSLSREQEQAKEIERLKSKITDIVYELKEVQSRVD